MSLTITRGGNPLAPQSFAEAERFARMLAASELVPREYRGKPEAILVAMQWGYEVGLNPLQAMQNIAVINGRPALWGDAALALVRGHAACEYVREGVEGEGDARYGWCEVKRRGEPPQRRTFCVADAKRAGLWGKAGPWQQYPDRMLQMRARGFALRDVFPDALRGVITREEAQDIPADAPVVDGEAVAVAMPPISAPLVHAPRASEPEPHWPLLSPDGKVLEAPPNKWGVWLRAALARMQSADAVRAWRDAMEVHLTAIAHAGGADDVDIAREEIARRIAELSLAAEAA
jgi:hypothetical protein